MSRRKQSVPARGKGGRRQTMGQWRKVLPGDNALRVGFRTAQELFLEMRSQMRSRHRRRGKPVTLKQVMRSVVTILVMHLSDFDYRRQPKSRRAVIARMLASLSVRLADVVEPKRVDK